VVNFSIFPSYKTKKDLHSNVKRDILNGKLSKTFDFVALRGKKGNQLERVNLLKRFSVESRERIKISVKGLSLTLSKIKKFFVLGFFWGRGKFYRVGITSSLLLFSIVFFIPYTKEEAFLMSSATAKSEPFHFFFSGEVLASDIIYDYGSGKTVIPPNRPEFSIRRYTVQPGDKLSSIAEKFNVSVDTIMWSNGLTSSVIKPGQVLEIPPIDGVIHVVQKGDTLSSLVKKYNLSKKGMNEQTIVDWNIFLEEPYTLEVGMKLIIPGGEIERPKPPTVAISQPSYGKPTTGIIIPPNPGLFIRPVPPGYGKLSQGFHPGHTAVDICDARAPDILAAASGKVIFSGWWKGGGGNSIWIDHGNGYVTYYCHMAVLYVRVGDNVVQGQPIGKMGSTGRSTGIHLHFAIHYKGVPVNPLNYISV